MWLRILIKIPTFVSMENIKSSIKGYLIAFLAFQMLVSGFLFQFPRLEQMKLINLHHHPIFDTIFVLLTNTAEVILPILFLIWMIWKKKELIKPYVFSYIFSTLIVQVLKHLVFSDALRPILYFKGTE